MISQDFRERLVSKAAANIRNIVDIAIEHSNEHKAVVVFDTEDELTRILTDAYRIALPDAEFMQFDPEMRENIIAKFDSLNPRDLVVLIQSSDFRLNEFRIRIQLFQRKLKVIDHLHLYRNTEDSWETYIDAIAYDTTWYRTVGPALKNILESAHTLRVCTPESELVVSGELEVPKLNIGDYAGMENIGGTFPIGEVFTEAKDLSTMQGSIMVYAFADANFHIGMYEPFRVDIQDGLIVGWADNTPDTFKQVVEQVKLHERPIIREIGFGLNRAITREKYLKDITAFERILGMHFSLGEKHTVYKKAGIKADKTRFHVDLFPTVSEVYADDVCIYRNGMYTV